MMSIVATAFINETPMTNTMALRLLCEVSSPGCSPIRTQVYGAAGQAKAKRANLHIGSIPLHSQTRATNPRAHKLLDEARRRLLGSKKTTEVAPVPAEPSSSHEGAE
jgi:hypothetical protein